MRLTLQEVDALKLQNLSKAFCEIKTIILPPNSSNILSKGRYMHVPSDIKNIRGFLSATWDLVVLCLLLYRLCMLVDLWQI